MGAMSVMIKPASGLCNMRCRYCFYMDEVSNRETGCLGIMEESTLEAVLREVLRHATGHCTVAFQGGEPTLAGLDFFRRAVELERELNVNRCVIQNVIQTNGYVIDAQWAEFFAREGFLVGVSLDGQKELHDLNRVDAAGKGTFGRVMNTVKLLQAHKVEFNILTVVTAQTCRHARKLYQFFDKLALPYQQYIPCLDPFDTQRGSFPWSLTPELYGRFLCDLFDCWYADAVKGKRKFNRYFDNLLAILAGGRPEACGMLGFCSSQIIVEADGSVYPCDFYVLDKWKLGNFRTDSLETIEEKRRQLQFVELSTKRHPDCLQCRWQSLCRGGCRRDRSNEIHGELGKSYFCQSYQMFFEYAYPRLLALSRYGR